MENEISAVQIELFTADLDKDIVVLKDHRYTVKRYSYMPMKFVDGEGKVIEERVFSFILCHGRRWFNGTSRNFRESELHRVLPEYRELIEATKRERSELVLKEREERKLFPQQKVIVFKNVTLTAREEFESIGVKTVTIYANGRPYRYGSMELPIDEVVNEALILRVALAKVVANHNVTFLEDYESGQVLERYTTVFVPYHFYIGFLINLAGEELEIYNFQGLTQMRFQTQKGWKDLTVKDFKNIELVGEMRGMKQLGCLMNKYSYVE